MKKERFIILLTQQEPLKSWSYGSLVAMTEHKENPLTSALSTVKKALKDNGGYPFTIQGLVVDRLRLYSNSEV